MSSQDVQKGVPTLLLVNLHGWMVVVGKKRRAEQHFKGDAELPDARRQLLLRNSTHFTSNMSSAVSK